MCSLQSFPIKTDFLLKGRFILLFPIFLSERKNLFYFVFREDKYVYRLVRGKAIRINCGNMTSRAGIRMQISSQHVCV